MQHSKNIHIGTSGWHYKHWMGNFYPAGVKPAAFMEYYLNFFHTVEINNSFYRLPSAETFHSWSNSVPADFIFAVKASRFITHMKKLKEPQQSFANFMNQVNVLGEKLGPILFQLPPMWNLNEERFKAFIEALPTAYQYTFEFRNTTWYNDRIYALLEKHNMAFCIYEIEYHLSPVITTADFVYVRLHGPEAKYASNYSEEALRHWAYLCRRWSNEGKQVYVYFDNDIFSYAPFNAKRLNELVQNEKMTFQMGS